MVPSLCSLSVVALVQSQLLAPIQPVEAPERPQLNRESQAQAAVAIAHDDAVPLPDPPVVQAGPDGDQTLAPASGDPYFLGFAAGAYHPPESERLSPELARSASWRRADERPVDERFAFIMFAARMTDARLAALEELGIRQLGTHPHYCIKAAIPVEALDSVAALPFVRWVGFSPVWQKLHPSLAARIERTPSDEPLDVYIDVFDSDLGPQSIRESIAAPHTVDRGVLGEVDGNDSGSARRTRSQGWQQRRLEALGVEVADYVELGRAFRARLTRATLEVVLAEDFVQFVEPIDVSGALHDETMPMVLADYVRAQFDGGTNAAAVVGVCDSGIDVGHSDLDHFYGVGWNFSGSSTGPWGDVDEHGSHVSGTFFGQGDTLAEQRGVAPGLGGLATRRIYSAKILNDAGSTPPGFSLAAVADVLDQSYTDSSGNVSPRPHVINNSWGTSFNGTPWIGSELHARVLDAEVYQDGALWVFAAGNSGGSGELCLEATSKNVLTVGSVRDFRSGSTDPGGLSSFSSEGPTGDSRWKPNVVAPGERVRSVDANTDGDYVDFQGTSMAAPHVAGVAAQLCDAYSFLRYRSARLASVLMATAMTRNNAILTSPSDTHLDSYGAGRVDAFRAMYATSQMSWTNWGFDQQPNSWRYSDFTVPSGTTRLVVCMTYHETGASGGANPVLVNNLDLYIDRAPILPAGDSGDYLAQRSSRDNTEIRILDNPASGAWRWKIWPENASSTCRVGVTVAFVSGDTTPSGVLTVSASKQYLRINETTSVTASVYNPAFVASAVFLDQNDTNQSLLSATSAMFDGVQRNLLDNAGFGFDVLLGDIPHGWSRNVNWSMRWLSEGAKAWSVEARSDNMVDQSAALTFYVDNTPPGAPTALGSTSHAVGVWDNSPTLTLTWGAAPDNVSGIAGYALTLTTAPALPPAIANVGSTTAASLAVTQGAWYVNLRAVDKCGNWGSSFASAGPYLVDLIQPTTPTQLSSSSHAPNAVSCQSVVTVNWAASFDSLSGIAGYVARWHPSANHNPGGAPNVAASETTYTEDIGVHNQGRWFHLRAVDHAGNLSPTVHFGPIFVQPPSVSTYCTAKTNSLGCLPAIGSSGVPSKSGGQFTVNCVNVLNQKAGFLFWGATAAAMPFQGGFNCVAPPAIRLPLSNSGGAAVGDSCSGAYAFTWTTSYMDAWSMNPGQSVFCQWWMRDPASPSATGLSNGLAFTVCY